MTDNPSTRELVLRAMEGASIHPVLRVLSGPHLGASLVLAQEGRAYTIGRSRACDLALEHDGDVSREHLEVRVDEGQVAIRDLRTRHGTRLAGARLEPDRAARWAYDSIVRIGGTEMDLVPPATYRLEQLVGAVDASAIEQPVDDASDEPSAREPESSQLVPASPPVAVEHSPAPADTRPAALDSPTAKRDAGSAAHKAIIVGAGTFVLLAVGVAIALLLSFR